MPLFKDKCFRAHWINITTYCGLLIPQFLACQSKRIKIQRYEGLFQAVFKTKIYLPSSSFFWNLQFILINKLHFSSAPGHQLHSARSAPQLTHPMGHNRLKLSPWYHTENRTREQQHMKHIRMCVRCHACDWSPARSHNIRLVAFQTC